jgi:hypothetical protein
VPASSRCATLTIPPRPPRYSFLWQNLTRKRSSRPLFGPHFCPLPEGALAKKSGLRLIYCWFKTLNLAILRSILNFWAKPPGGEGEWGTPRRIFPPLPGRKEPGEGEKPAERLPLVTALVRPFHPIADARST